MFLDSNFYKKLNSKGSDMYQICNRILEISILKLIQNEKKLRHVPWNLISVYTLALLDDFEKLNEWFIKKNN